MWSYLGGIWQCRYFWLSMVGLGLRGRYARARLGLGWSLVQPLAMAGILCAAFHGIFKVPIADFLPYLLVGLALWNFVLNSTMQGCRCFLAARTYINQYPAPLAIWPLRTVLEAGFYLILGLAISILVTWLLTGRFDPLALISLFPGVVLLLIFGWSLATLAGLAYVHFRDTQYLLELSFQALFYLTPIMYRLSDVGASARMMLILRYHPIVHFLHLLRDPIIDGHIPSPGMYARAVIVALSAAAIAIWTLRRVERGLIYRL
jgi:ABC-type polysaccharide/polyol phosphate export permease